MEDSGLQPGDVVYSLDGHRIYNYNNLTFFLGRAGDTLDFVVLRDGEKVRLDAFAQALEVYPGPVCFNGGLVTPEDCKAFHARFPQVEHVMIGQGLLADPALTRKAKAEAPPRWTSCVPSTTCSTAPISPSSRESGAPCFT